MKIAVIDDYQDAFRKLACAAKLKGHDITVYRDTEKDAARFAARLEGYEAVIMTQQRSPLPKALVEAQSGRIWVETEAGVGSTFSVLMPVVVELPAENQP